MSSFRTYCHQGLRPLVLSDESAIEMASVDIDWGNLSPAGISIGDVVQIADVPASHQVADWKFISDKIDSNGTPTVAFTLGWLNSAKTAINGGTYDAWTAAGGITAGQTAGVNAPTGATGANAFLSGRGTLRTVGLVATAATATAAMTGKVGSLILYLRSGLY